MSGHVGVAVPVTTVWTSPEAPRPLDSAAVADPPDVAAWAASLDDGLRLGLHGLTSTQGLLGEPVMVLEERGDWAEVVLPWQPSRTHPRGYRGWVPRAHLGPSPEPAVLYATVVVPTSTTDAGTPLSRGTVLPVLDREDERVRVAVTGGSPWVAAADVHVAPFGRVDRSVDALLAGARQHLGLSYLWGGTSGWGLDCSGLVHLSHRVAGVTVPRDASDQQPVATPVEIDAAGPGDLFFFAKPDGRVTHVGFVTNQPGEPLRMLHAPEGGGLVEDAPMADDRRASLVSAGRLLR
ncbi:NlpC/P60 family protein [Solicola sp. PLA-1-18]|uniref:C40 family peptidase n=1 Tax=Solicola sp. PLA-1-18 TaxID=3380532 RepID=UPI003B7D99E6